MNSTRKSITPVDLKGGHELQIPNGCEQIMQQKQENKAAPKIKKDTTQCSWFFKFLMALLTVISVVVLTAVIMIILMKNNNNKRNIL